MTSMSLWHGPYCYIDARFCCHEYDEALSFALGTVSLFQAEARAHNAGEYVETVICEC